jgi:signal transduction histidine kinase/signal recognition particle receptor subunit beta
MVQFDNQYRQIKIKVVYYGPALGGKTTCLQYIHKVTDPTRRTKLYSLNTAADRTLFFDLLSLNLGKIRGYKLALQLYTVPGQVQYNATRKAVLSGADGVVFVADSQVGCREPNMESLENLWENMASNGLDRDTVPLVLHYNKRDLSPLLEVADMEADLNRRANPAFPSVALTGEGVIEGFAAICERTLTSVADKLGVGTNPQAIQRLQQQARDALKPYIGESEVEPAESEVQVTVPSETADSTKPLDHDLLVGEAVRANLAMTDLNTQLDTVSRHLRRKVNVLEGIQEFSTAIANERDPGGVLKKLLATAVRLLGVQGAAVLSVPSSGPVREALVHGVSRDPLLSTADTAGEPLALGILNAREAVLIARELDDTGSDLTVETVEQAGFASALAVPMIAQDRAVGMLTVYGDADRAALDEDDLGLAEVLATSAAMGPANAQAWRQLEEFNRGLEAEVAARTEELRQSLDEVRRLADDLGEKNRLLEDAYRELSELDRIKNELITRISHELKTPVTSLVTAAKILDKYKDAPAEKSARFITIIREEAEKLSEIIQSVFQASILASGAQEIERTLVPVDELFREAISPLRELSQERGVSLHVLIPSGLDSVSCDRETMVSAFRAVVKNGIEFNRKGGSVKVEVHRRPREDGLWLVFRFVDTGAGIAEHELPHVFETFWQGGNVLTEKPRGVGLGLAIAKRIVENHGGRISIESTHGEGTTVTILVPQSASA